MRTAVDRMSIGIEREVDINDFDGYKSDKRFVCPECGEYVFAATGKRNGFRHYKGKGVDCDRRVDNKVELSFYERVGLPIYLINENNNFSLGIGFFALGSSILEKAQNDNLSVIIESKTSNGSLQDKHLIDFTFYENDITIKTINSIPCYEGNYTIRTSNDKSYASQALNIKWADYADGFSNSGAVFTYSEYRGKKIRKNDTITTNTEYFLLTFDRGFNTPVEVEKKYIDSLKIGQKICHINKILIKPSNNEEFRQLENYFWEYFKLKLLYNKPNLVQMWPPAIKTDDINYTLPLKSKNNVFIKVNSSLNSPKVYKYLERHYDEMYIAEDYNNNKYVRLPISKSIIPLSIDRKYMANSQMFVTDIFFDTNHAIKIDINNTDVFSTNSIEQTNLWVEEYISLNNNIKVDMIQFLNDNSILKISFNTSDSHIIKLDIKSESVGLYYQKLGRFLYKCCKPEIKQKFSHVSLDFEKILRELDTQCVDVPAKYKNINSRMKKFPQINRLVRPFLVNDKIPVGVLKALVAGGLFNEK